MSSSPEAVPGYDQVVMPSLRVEIAQQELHHSTAWCMMSCEILEMDMVLMLIKNTPGHIETALGVAEPS